MTHGDKGYPAREGHQKGHATDDLGGRRAGLVMLTIGESARGEAPKGLTASHVERRVQFTVED